MSRRSSARRRSRSSAVDTQCEIAASDFQMASFVSALSGMRQRYRPGARRSRSSRRSVRPHQSKQLPPNMEQALSHRSSRACPRSICGSGRYSGGMGLYREHILPVLVDRACGTAGLKKWRSELSSGLSGRVLEIGFGSGLNIEHYPSTVEKVLAVEPSAKGFRIAQRRIDNSSVPVELVGLDGQSISLPDDSCDDALCTFALCTIPDTDAALAEVLRVLRPGGRFHFLEHGLAPDAGVAVWQRRLEPLQRRVADGCHLTRDPVALVRGAGFTLDDIDQHYGVGPKPWSWFTRGVAVKPG